MEERGATIEAKLQEAERRTRESHITSVGDSGKIGREMLCQDKHAPPKSGLSPGTLSPKKTRGVKLQMEELEEFLKLRIWQLERNKFCQSLVDMSEYERGQRDAFIRILKKITGDERSVREIVESDKIEWGPLAEK